MRRYAPHNTHAETWSSPPARRVDARQRLLSTFRTLLSSLTPYTFAKSPPSTSKSALDDAPSPHSRHDDVYAEARLDALRRWLRLAAPLSPEPRAALHALVRPNARLVRRADAAAAPYAARAICLSCGAVLRAGARPPPPATAPRLFGRSFVWQLVVLACFWLLYVMLAFARAFRSLRRRLRRRRAVGLAKAALERCLPTARFYSAWFATASALDDLEGRVSWHAAAYPRSLCGTCAGEWNEEALQSEHESSSKQLENKLNAVCDFNMLSAKLTELSALYQRGDVRGLAFALRANLIRNLGGMCHPELHAHSRVGTKQIVEDYVNVVSYLLAYIAQSEPQLVQNAQLQPLGAPIDPSDGPLVGEGALTMSETPSRGKSATSPLETQSEKSNNKLLTIEDKLTFLNEARHAYGRTALMLSGGAAMGLNHLGVVKALLDQGMLPKVVCGTSAGALVASIVGIYNDEELSDILQTEDLINPITQQPFSFKYFDDHASFSRRVRRFIRKGCIHDIHMLQDCLRKNYGDLTFEEAYTKTRRILNITVCPLRSSSDPPLLLNYLTAPHVLIWSAASASCALPLVFAPVELVAKSASGRLVHYHPDGVRWIDGSITSDVPLSRIGELFNVNHFIVSQTNPHVIPRSMPIMQTRIALLIKSELQFRYWQMLQMGLIPKLLASIFPHFMQPYAGDVTIMPDVRLSDLTTLLRNPTPETVMSSIRRGEIQTFPFLDRIRLHCLIEQTLDTSVEDVARTARREEVRHASPSRSKSSLNGRAPSWLWLDTRSMLASGAVAAVTSRIGGTWKAGEDAQYVHAKEETIGSEEEGQEGTNGGAGKATAWRSQKAIDKGDGSHAVLDEILLELAAAGEGESAGDSVELSCTSRSESSDDSIEEDRMIC